MTEIGFAHVNIPKTLEKDSRQYSIMYNQNRFNFFKFIDFARMRANSLRRVSKRSKEIVGRINDVLGDDKTKEVDFMLLENYLDAKVDTSMILSVYDEYFLQYTREEFDEFYKKYQ